MKNRLFEKLRSVWPLALLCVGTAVALCVFAPALPAYQTLVAPDGAANLSRPGFLQRVAECAFSGRTFLSFEDLLKVALPSLAYHELSFALCSGLTAVALAVYLRVLGLPLVACCGGGLAMAFAGYNFTLFHAGHRGLFVLTPHVLFLLALVERILRKPDVVSACLAALCVVAGVEAQPDIAVFYLLLVAAYAVFRAISFARAETPKAYFGARWKAFVVCAACLVAVGAAAGFGTIRKTFAQTIAGRAAQIGSASAVAESGAAGDAKAAARERWIFCTNWSLPPAEAVEFVAPSARGFEPGHPKGPYWGSVGRSFEWDETHEGFANFRQHSLYLGAVTVAFAFAGLVFGLRRRRGAGLTIFWAGAAALSLLLAFGRYAPVYRLFYALPMMDMVRCPMKFFHLTEAAVSILFAFGLRDTMVLAGRGDEARGAVRVCLGGLCALAAGLAIASFAFDPAAHRETWRLMGLLSGNAELDRNLMEAFAGRYVDALQHGALLVALSAVAIGVVTLTGLGGRRCIGAAIAFGAVVATTIDLAGAAAPYATVSDVSLRYEDNPMAKAARALAPTPDGHSWTYLQLTQRPLPMGAVPVLDSLEEAGLRCADPFSTYDAGQDTVKAYRAFSSDLLRRWDFYGTTALLLSPEVAREWAKAGIATLVGLYEADGTGRIRSAKPGKASIVLAKPTRAVPPSVGVYHAWRVAKPGLDTALDEMKRPGFDFRRELVLAEANGLAASEAKDAVEAAEWVVPPSRAGRLRAVVKCAPKTPGILFVREWCLRRYAKVGAKIGEASVPVYRANGFYLAVPVPAGASEVTLSAAIPWGVFVFALAMSVFGLIFLCVWCVRRTRAGQGSAGGGGGETR